MEEAKRAKAWPYACLESSLLLRHRLFQKIPAVLYHNGCFVENECHAELLLCTNPVRLKEPLH